MRISEVVDALESVKKEVGDCQVYFSLNNNDNIVMDTYELGKSDYSEDDDCIVVPLVEE